MDAWLEGNRDRVLMKKSRFGAKVFVHSTYQDYFIEAIKAWLPLFTSKFKVLMGCLYMKCHYLVIPLLK